MYSFTRAKTMMRRLFKDLLTKIRYLYLSQLTIAQKFDYFYRKNVFEGTESISGEGSSLRQTKKLSGELTKLFRELHITSLVDAPCGDINWIKRLDLASITYTGVDVVEALIDEHIKTRANKKRKFVCADLITYVPPRVDLILCRDCLVHLSFKDAKKVLHNFKQSGSTYLLTTTFTDRRGNVDLGSSIWRTLNLQLAPFSLGKPLQILNEGCTEMDNQFSDKSLGLWKLSNLPV